MPIPFEYGDAIAEWVLSIHTIHEWPECQKFCLHKLSSDLPNILALPLLACQAVGGTPSDAIPLASAWSMLRYAADLLDAIQDEDTLPSIANDPSTAIGFANGLIFSAFDSISSMRNPKLVREVVTLFSKTAFQASHGQHLSQQRNGRDDITLESYWHATILKSGSIFRAGLGGGAMAGNASDQYIAALDDFGNALGIIRQIIDDCRDVFERTETGAYEVTLPLLMLALRREEPVVELMANLNSRETLLAAFTESNVPEMITSVLLEWHRRALEGLQILEHNEAVIALEGILTDFVTTPWWNLARE